MNVHCRLCVALHFLRLLVCSVLLNSVVAAAYSADRIKVDVRINGKPSRLIFDTGASHFLLFRPAAERLGLTITNASALQRGTRGTVPAGVTELCKLDLWDRMIETQFRVVDMPQGIRPEMDGVLGWLPLQSNIFYFDSERETVRMAKSVPREALMWTKFSLSTNSLGLEIDIPGTRPSRMMVDTGMHGGVFLNPARWRQWYANCSNAPTTMNALFNVHDGVVVTPESWADRINFGSLDIKDVPVTEASPVFTTILGFEGAIGLYGLRRIDLVVDGLNKIAYMRAAKAAAPPYVHNRLGAVFVPSNLQSDELLARVIEKTPAHDAGIQVGDRLLKVGDLDVSRWRTDPAVMPLSRFWNATAGTVLNLTLSRSDEEFKVRVTLREILGPSEQQAADKK